MNLHKLGVTCCWLMLISVIHCTKVFGQKENSENTHVVKIGAVDQGTAASKALANVTTVLTRRGFPSTYILYPKYDAMLAALDSGDIDIAWNVDSKGLELLVETLREGEEQHFKDLPEGNNGIAARYPGDKGIENDPAVVFADDFEGHANASDLKKKWRSVFSISGAEIVADGSRPSGAKTLALIVKKNEHRAGASHDLEEPLDTLFLRWYVKFDADWSAGGSVHNGGSVMAFSPEHKGRMAPHIPADGRNKFLVNFANNNAAGAAPGHMSIYIYHPDQAGQYGDYFYPSGKVAPGGKNRSGAAMFGKHFKPRLDFSPQLGRWYCYEYMVKANTPGRRDGRVAAWIDGKLIADFPNLRLRDVANLKIDHFGLRMYIGDNSKQANQKWHDNVVAATSYIGPMVEAR